MVEDNELQQQYEGKERPNLNSFFQLTPRKYLPLWTWEPLEARVLHRRELTLRRRRHGHDRVRAGETEQEGASASKREAQEASARESGWCPLGGEGGEVKFHIWCHHCCPTFNNNHNNNNTKTQKKKKKKHTHTRGEAKRETERERGWDRDREHAQRDK